MTGGPPSPFPIPIPMSKPKRKPYSRKELGRVGSPGCIITPRAEHTADHNNQYGLVGPGDSGAGAGAGAADRSNWRAGEGTRRNGAGKQPCRRTESGVCGPAARFFYMFSVALASFELGRCSCCLGARLFVYTHPQIEPLGMQSTMQVRGFCGKSHKSIPGFNMLGTGNGTAG